MKEITQKTLAKHIAKSASELKAEDIRILNLGGLSSFTDFFVICSGTSDRHVQSIADRIVVDQKKDGHANLGIEGIEKGDWVLIDFGGVVAHVFHPETRDFYSIEKLWGDAPEVKYKGITA